MKEYKKLLFILERGKKYTENFLVSKSSKKAFDEALEDGMIYVSGKTDISVLQYSLTEKGIQNR